VQIIHLQRRARSNIIKRFVWSFLTLPGIRQCNPQARTTILVTNFDKNILIGEKRYRVTVGRYIIFEWHVDT